MSRDGNSEKPGIINSAIRKVRGATDKVRDAGASALRGIAARLEVPKATFEIAETRIDFGVDVAGDTLWATQAQIAELFGVSVKTVSEHLANAYSDDEISREATFRKFRIVQAEGTRQVEREVDHFNLEAIFAVGSRVKSPRAGQFRQWAFRILKEYVVHGFVLNERRLREDPAAAQSAAEKIRELRYSEANLYSRVRDAVVMVANDYDGTADHVRQFFARMQDKFHYAACERTAQQILLSRADGTKDHMGMTCRLNNKPTLKDAQTAKNYLSDQELKLQMIAGDLFFSFVENMIVRGRTMTTAQLLAKIDEVFKFGEMPQFPGYVGPYIKPQVEAHVRQQYDLFKNRTAQGRYDEAHRPSRT